MFSRIRPVHVLIFFVGGLALVLAGLLGEKIGSPIPMVVVLLLLAFISISVHSDNP